MVIIMKKCIIASILALMLSLTTFAQATALPETKINDWAVPDVGRAARLGLLTDTLHEGHYTPPIFGTRCQLCGKGHR